MVRNYKDNRDGNFIIHLKHVLGPQRDVSEDASQHMFVWKKENYPELGFFTWSTIMCDNMSSLISVR